MRPVLPRIFSDVGVLLLRHDRAAGAEVVGKFDELEVLRGERHEFFGEAREVHVAHGGGRIEFDHVVAIGDGVDGVFRRTVEAEVRGREFAVDREVGAC